MLYFTCVLALVSNENSVQQQLVCPLENEALYSSLFYNDVVNSAFELSHLCLESNAWLAIRSRVVEDLPLQAKHLSLDLAPLLGTLH